MSQQQTCPLLRRSSGYDEPQPAASNHRSPGLAFSILVTGAARRTLVAPAHPRSVPYGRAFTCDALAAWHLHDLRPDVELCVSELSTNAVRYGAGPLIGLSLSLTAGDANCTLLVEVFNRDGGEPVATVPERTGNNGRGLLLVSALSSRWGHDLVGGQWRRAWCAFELPSDAPRQP